MISAEPDGLFARLVRWVRRLDTQRDPSGIDATARRKAAMVFQSRRAREVLFGEHAVLFGEPAWDILLDLFLAHAAGGGRTLDELCARTRVLPASAGRWLDTLIDRQLVICRVQGGDKKTARISLSSTGVRLIADCLTPARGAA